MLSIHNTVANVFISYRSADRQVALRLADQIRSAGHSVWIDVEQIGIGDTIVGKLEQGLSGATYVVLCYSQSDVSSPFITREWYSTLARQLEHRDVKLLPVRLTGGQPPAILADIRYADLVTNWAAGISALLHAIK
jgi:ABC-type taurine transport system substrate-binding protein